MRIVSANVDSDVDECMQKPFGNVVNVYGCCMSTCVGLSSTRPGQLCIRRGHGVNLCMALYVDDLCSPRMFVGLFTSIQLTPGELYLQS